MQHLPTLAGFMDEKADKLDDLSLSVKWVPTPSERSPSSGG